MSKSPGHQKWPDHKVEEHHLGQRVTVEIGGQLVADSRDVIEVDEDQHPARFYFPRSDVKMALLRRSATTTECPFKGEAHYFDLELGQRKLADAVWTYETPYEEHQQLQDRLAFYDDKIEDLRISVAG